MPLTINIPASASGDDFCIDLSILDDVIDEADVEQFEFFFENLSSDFAQPGDPDTLCVNIQDGNSECACDLMSHTTMS